MLKKENKNKKAEEILLKEKERLEEELKKLTNIEDGEMAPDLGDDFDEDIEADQVEEMGNSLALRQDLEKNLKSVEESLEKIKKGIYGLCEACGKPIRMIRIKIAPAAKLCAKCVKKDEKR